METQLSKRKNYKNKKKISGCFWMVGLSLNYVTGIEVVSQFCLSDGRSIEWWVNAVSWIVGHFSSPPSVCKDPHTSSSLVHVIHHDLPDPSIKKL